MDLRSEGHHNILVEVVRAQCERDCLADLLAVDSRINRDLVVARCQLDRIGDARQLISRIFGCFPPPGANQFPILT